jgi:ribonuclease HIII
MNYVFGIDQAHLPEFLDYYKDYDSQTDNPSALVVFRSPEVVVTVFKTLKVMIQGNGAQDEYLMWSELFGFEPEAAKTAEAVQKKPQEDRSPYYLTTSFGSDEVGTGDFYGPIVVCTAFVDKTQIPDLERLHIKDSKQMSDETILAVGETLKKMLPHVILVVDDPKYNDLVKEGYNLNKMKAYLHNHAIKKCLAKVQSAYDYVILDEFCPKDLYFGYLKGVDAFHGITFLTKGESAHLAVAAASVIARFTFLHEMEDLNQKVGLRLPLGASAAVDLIGKRIVLEKGFDYLPGIAKMNFKNAEKIQEMVRKH